jgi:ferritin
MLRPTVEQALNDQINHELSAAYLYLSMSAHFDTQGYSGFARWMRLQSQEEIAHGMKLFDFLLARGGKVALQAIEKPPSEFGAPLDVFKRALEHEVSVTALINKLYATAMKESDYVTTAELQWFLTEQVEEEKTAADVVQRLKIANADPNALLLLDRELGSRTGAG